MTTCPIRTMAGRPNAAAPSAARASMRSTRSSMSCRSAADMPRLVLIRHGQSAWNLENRFTGWWDVDLTDLGAREAKEAGELMAARGLDFALCFTSVPPRALKIGRAQMWATGGQNG